MHLASYLQDTGALSPVGGILTPPDKLAVSAPYLALLGIVLTVAVVVLASELGMELPFFAICPMITIYFGSASQDKSCVKKATTQHFRSPVFIAVLLGLVASPFSLNPRNPLVVSFTIALEMIGGAFLSSRRLCSASNCVRCLLRKILPLVLVSGVIQTGLEPYLTYLLVSSDYSTYSHAEYAAMQTSIGKRCSDIVYRALADEGFKVDFGATLYQLTSELVKIAGNLMFGTGLQFSNAKYLIDRDLCSLRVTVDACPICEFVQSDHVVCHLVSGFLAELVEAFLSKFADVKVDSVETACIARKDPYCSFDTRWRIPIGLPTPRIQDLEIHIDERALSEKVSEILETGFYQTAVAIAQKRRGLA